MTAALVIIAVALAAAALFSVRVLREYERAVVFRLGRLLPVKGPGPCCCGPASTGWCASISARSR